MAFNYIKIINHKINYFLFHIFSKSPAFIRHYISKLYFHPKFNKGRDFREDDNDMQDKRRMREERGFKRLQQHKWQPGYVMPQHYRGNGYKVDYKSHDLPKPSRNQQWYKINNDYILVDTDSNNIVRIQGF